jgi:hypothetical protein
MSRENFITNLLNVKSSDILAVDYISQKHRRPRIKIPYSEIPSCIRP